MTVKCPTCGKPAVYSLSNPFRPFCSERCKTLDLGAWADEKYKVPVSSEEETPPVNAKSGPEGLRESLLDEQMPPKHHLN
ncbi:MAG: DNA gyrase inhibitor YacG [Candidatus Competibacteraceae bacterium]|nr:DNA gyrase inhibitor YacG [Candidatus Competibacteraceae bacterium]